MLVTPSCSVLNPLFFQFHNRKDAEPRSTRILSALAALYLVLQYFNRITGPTSIRYSTVKGIFLQDDIHTNASSFDYVRSNLS
jgi:hypothetical protein